MLLPTRVRLVLALSPILALAPASAQKVPPPAPPARPVALSADGAFAAQKAAFLSLPLESRKAAQDALVWLGFYNGASDGDFGKRTRDAIVGWQQSQKAAGDGVLSAGELTTLMAAAEKARAAAGFATVDDKKTGARIGAPTKLMAARGGPRLDLAAGPNADLAALYQRLSAETASRKVAYKAMKPDQFFVVSGQEGPTKFYSRYEKKANANPPVRGFTFAYPAARASELDRVALAVASSFEAFPEPHGATAAATPSAAPQPVAAPPPPPTPSATALIIGPGRALTALKPDDCPKATVGGRPVRFERTDVGTSLAILAGDFGGEGGPPRVSALAPDLIVLSAGGDRIEAAPASLAGDAERPLVVAAVGKAASGSPVFDRAGDLAGLVAPIAEEPKRIGGVPLAAPHSLIVPQAVGAFLAGGELKPQPAAATALTTGAIAERERHAVAQVFCDQ